MSMNTRRSFLYAAIVVAVTLSACTSGEIGPTEADLSSVIPAQDQGGIKVRTFVHEASDIDEPFIVVEQMPELLGGLTGLAAKIQYPTAGCPTSLQGRVFLQFIVDKEGNVQEPKVVRSLSEGCDAEALRAIRDLEFEPGLQRGKRVNVKMSLPVTFRTD